MIDPETFMSNYDRHRQALAKLTQANKDLVFDALAAANITEVFVEFDGEGDSGQIESVSAIRSEETVALPTVNVTLQHLSWGDIEPVAAESTLQQAIETLCYDYLEVTQGGWENNDGAFGEFRLDVATRTVELEFNSRFTDINTTNHTF